MDVEVNDQVKFPQAPGHWNRDRVYRVVAVSAAGVEVECGEHRYRLTNAEANQLGMTAADRATEK